MDHIRAGRRLPRLPQPCDPWPRHDRQSLSQSHGPGSSDERRRRFWGEMYRRRKHGGADAREGVEGGYQSRGQRRNEQRYRHHAIRTSPERLSLKLVNQADRPHREHAEAFWSVGRARAPGTDEEIRLLLEALHSLAYGGVTAVADSSFPSKYGQCRGRSATRSLSS